MSENRKDDSQQGAGSNQETAEVAVSPVEMIDLSHLEFIPPLRSGRNRAPDAVIDLCTPDGPRSRPVNITSDISYSAPSRRRTFNQSTATPLVVDVDDVSPPKRIQRDLELSQKEDSYKCPVCMDSVTKREPVSTKCGHVFCRECIQTAISSTQKCPLCNKKLTTHQYSRIYL
uniref:E3 ubiquitin-protein ligase RNF4 isoform X1 n=1 Tax=Drosophila rhopaloa TaxID=1041015 RepID=A0A6P4FLR5_DRORH